MNINLNLNKDMFSPKFYPYLQDYSHRWEIYMGSAGSSKSYFITQKLIIRGLQEKIKILVCRRYGTTIRNSCFALFKEILTKWKIIDKCRINSSGLIIILPNGTEIIFMGLDDETKLLSITGIASVFIEEAFEVPKDIVEQLNLRLRGPIENKQILMAFNPININSWLYDFCNSPPENSLYIHSTYKDNPFLDTEYIQQLEQLYITNPAKAKVFCDGEWGANPSGLVLTNWRIEDFSLKEIIENKYERRPGMDFGFIDPTAIVDSFYDEDNKRIYIYNEFYKKGCQLSEILNQIKKMELMKTKIRADAAEPRTIEYFKSQGAYVVPCLKGRNSVKARISFLKNHLLIVHPQCTNVKMELENFSYIKNKMTGDWTEETTHEFSHSIDALGYAYSDIYARSKLRSISKNLF